MSPDSTEPQVVFDWGPEESQDKFFRLQTEPEGTRITVHPGLSRAQVDQVAETLGELGPSVIKAWERHTGFTA